MEQLHHKESLPCQDHPLQDSCQQVIHFYDIDYLGVPLRNQAYQQWDYLYSKQLEEPSDQHLVVETASLVQIYLVLLYHSL